MIGNPENGRRPPKAARQGCSLPSARTSVLQQGRPTWLLRRSLGLPGCFEIRTPRNGATLRTRLAGGELREETFESAEEKPERATRTTSPLAVRPPACGRGFAGAGPAENFPLRRLAVRGSYRRGCDVSRSRRGAELPRRDELPRAAGRRPGPALHRGRRTRAPRSAEPEVRRKVLGRDSDGSPPTPCSRPR